MKANSFVIEDSDITLHFEDQTMILRNPSANTPNQFFEKYNPTPPKDINDLIKYQGSYYSEELETTYKFMIDDGKLFLRINNNTQRQIYPPIDNVVWNSMKMVWIGFAEIKFLVDSSEEVIGFSIGDSRVRGVSFKKMRDSKS